MFKSEQIETFLTQRGDTNIENTDNCPLGFLLFLEPEKKCSKETVIENVIDLAVRNFQPDPILEHVELALPPIPTHESKYTNFATYFGDKSRWRNNREENKDFYLLRHGSQWRCLPIYGKNATEKLRNECHLETDVSYSLSKYITSAYPFRSLAWMLSSERNASAHCASLTARILKKAISTTIIDKSPNYYGPSTLYAAACTHVKHVAAYMGAGETKPVEEEVLIGMEKLLHGPASETLIQEVGDAAALNVISHLTLKVMNKQLGGDEVSQIMAQKQLATALIRWITLRQPEPDDQA